MQITAAELFLLLSLDHGSHANRLPKTLCKKEVCIIVNLEKKDFSFKHQIKML
jgi:hypothetical protein